MSETPASPRAGWYPDPQVPGQMRFWDGTVWAQQSQHSSSRPVGRLFTATSRIIAVGLGLTCAILVARTALYVWIGLRLRQIVADGDFGTLDATRRIDALFGVGLFAVIPLVGISWMIWQHQLARCATPSALRRTPGWHAWSWLIPIGNFWIPFQNVSDLWRSVAGRGSIRILRVWWGSLFILWFASTIVTNQWDDLGSVDRVRFLTLVSSVMYLFCAVTVSLALYIAVTLTAAGVQRSRTLVSASESPAV